MTAVADKDIPVCVPPDPATRAPKFAFPPLACDCHAHICGPQAIYKYIPERIYSPPDALLADYQPVAAARSAASARCWCSRVSTAPTIPPCWRR